MLNKNRDCEGVNGGVLTHPQPHIIKPELNKISSGL